MGKYPPIQGGISAQSYWMCRWLAERGHQVDVVTNADEVEEPYRIRLQRDDGAWLAGKRGAGAVRVWRTEAPTAAYRHIPATNPVVTKLATLAAEAIEKHRSELVVGFYLEPYAIAAHLAATWTGRPLVIRHAGSDVGRLLELGQLRRSYLEVLRRASAVCTRPVARTRLLALGVPEERLVPEPAFLAPRHLFHPDAAPLDIDGHLAGLGLAPLGAEVPIVSLYGKMGSTKGTFALLDALAALAREGLRFALLAATHGSDEDERRFAEMIAAGKLARQVRKLPFLPHWRVPSLLRASSLACVLENGFPIEAHAPGLPGEVLACGTALLVSAEVARKQLFAPRLIHGHNAFVVRDPGDRDELIGVLRGALDEPGRLRAIGARGSRLLPEPTPAADQIRPYEEIFAAVLAADVSRLSAAAERQPVEAVPTGEEARSWLALQEPHPSIARPEVLDELFFRNVGGTSRPSPDPTAVPVLANNVVIRPYSRNMEDQRDLSPCAYAFQHLPFRDRARTLRLGLGHYLVSRLVNGRRSLKDIARTLDRQHRGTGQRVRAAAQDLFDEGIIIFPSRKERDHGPEKTHRLAQASRQEGRPGRR